MPNNNKQTKRDSLCNSNINFTVTKTISVFEVISILQLRRSWRLGSWTLQATFVAANLPKKLTAAKKKKEREGQFGHCKKFTLSPENWFCRACKLKVKRCCKLCTFLQKHFVQLQLSNCGATPPPPPPPFRSSLLARPPCTGQHTLASSAVLC